MAFLGWLPSEGLGGENIYPEIPQKLPKGSFESWPIGSFLDSYGLEVEKTCRYGHPRKV